MNDDYSKRALLQFVDYAIEKGLVNGNTGIGWKGCCVKILEDVTEDMDVRSVDVPTAIRKYNNKHPGELSPSSLKEYQRRLGRVIAEFSGYVADPTAYRGTGKLPSKVGGNGPESSAKRKKSTALERSEGTSAKPMLALPAPPPVASGLTLAYPLRADFLAQVVIPRDLKADEARRLGAFIMTLASDFQPGT